MRWQLGERSAKHVSDIKRAVKKADAVWLAPDPDREGEAIAWHVQELLEEDGLLAGKDVHRVTFNEITKTAVQKAFQNARGLDKPLIEAYLARPDNSMIGIYFDQMKGITDPIVLISCGYEIVATRGCHVDPAFTPVWRL